MREYLIDTNIIFELARKSPNPNVKKFISGTSRLLVSTMMFHELGYGVEVAVPEQKIRLSSFVAAMRNRFGARAIPVTLEIAETAGQFRAIEKNVGRILTVTDSIIAATAVVKGAVLVTRNVKDFENLKLEILNPFT